MPSIKRRVTATTRNALADEQFAVIPQGGAILNMYAAGVTGTDDVGLSVNDKQILGTSDVNIEISADVIDNTRDQLVFNEVVPPGQLIVPVTVTTELQFLIVLQYLQ